MLLDVQALTLAYHGHPVVKDVSFSVAQGRIACLLGPSGCGKTSLLRAIAGFEPLQSGCVKLSAETVSEAGWQLPPEQRGVGMVFQEFALFPHLTVADNIGFGLRGQTAARRQQRITELLALIGLPDCARRYPHQLSGGQQQRVALARALAPRPRLLLLDEPFSSLDVSLREDMAREVGRILRQEAMTAVLVTHDQMEAFAMADEIGVMEAGHLRQWDTAYNLYHSPASRFVAQFIGQGAWLSGSVLDAQRVQTALGVLSSDQALNAAAGSRVQVLVRPDDVLCADAAATVQAEVVSRRFRGADYLYELRLDSGETVLSLAHSHDAHALGERIGVQADTRHLIVFGDS